jgi:hypothetical protein
MIFARDMRAPANDIGYMRAPANDIGYMRAPADKSTDIVLFFLQIIFSSPSA